MQGCEQSLDVKAGVSTCILLRTFGVWNVQEGEGQGSVCGWRAKDREMAVTRLPHFGAELLRILHSNPSGSVGRYFCQGRKIDPHGGDCFRPPTGRTGSYSLEAASRDPYSLSPDWAGTLSGFGSEGEGERLQGAQSPFPRLCRWCLLRSLGTPNPAPPGEVTSFLHGPWGW